MTPKARLIRHKMSCVFVVVTITLLPSQASPYYYHHLLSSDEWQIETQHLEMSIRRFIVNSSYVRTPFTVGRSFSVATSSSGGGASARYGEKKARVEPTPTSEFPLQNEGSKDSPPALGYNLVLQRMANIVLNVTDKQQPVKLLHVHPENALLLYMGKVSENVNINIT